METIDSLLEVVERSGNASNTVLNDLLKELRRTKTYRPDLVVEHGPTLLYRASESDMWTLIEQIFVAALDVGNDELANHCLKMIMRKFPKSTRVGRLTGMMAEAQGDFDKALFIYDELLKEQPANILIMKRKVAVVRSKGSIPDTINELSTVIKHFPFDTQAWIELASIYISASKLEEAAHCYEELILLEPNNAHYHARLAETYFSIGDYDRLILARKHYTSSLTLLAPSVNLRALYGLIYTCKAVLADSSSESKSKKELPGASGVSDREVNSELYLWAKDTLESIIFHDKSGKKHLHANL